MSQPPRAAHLLNFAPSALLLLVGAFLVALSLLRNDASRAGEPVAAAEPVTASLADAELKPARKVKQAPKVSRAAAKVARRTRKAVPRAAKPRRPRQPVRPVVSSPSEPAPPNDPLWRDSWALAKANAPSAWRLTTGRTETVVAVLDTGADLGHPDLQGSFVAGFDVVNQDADPSDDHGHGTMVTGVIAARSQQRDRRHEHVLALLGDAGEGDRRRRHRQRLGHRRRDRLGGRPRRQRDQHELHDERARRAVAAAIAHARSRGVVLVAAAGNTGTADATFPAAYPGVLSVAGTDAADARYEWSSYGSWVRVAAPGCNLTTAPGGGYGEFCGTSSATAFLSGIVGLARSFARDLPRRRSRAP